MKSRKRLENDSQAKWFSFDNATSKAERDRLYVKYANANNTSSHSMTGTPFTNMNTSSGTWQQIPSAWQSQPDLAKEIAKVKKTVFALAKLLTAIYDSDDSCESRCGECIPCLVSASLEEITKEEMEALAGENDSPISSFPSWSQTITTNTNTWPQVYTTTYTTDSTTVH